MLSTSYIYAQQKTHKENCHQRAAGNLKKPKSDSDSDTSDEEQIDPIFKTSKEERHYGTIPGSTLATKMPLATPGLMQTPQWKEDPVIR